ncbi:MAG TPA: hypothetical protein DIU39_08550 [Flavobacteriales bacterium]|nr:hypothetical protein [Flavobacteriales bacterium]|tara:strand:+ start:19496 stop:20824 length:1329 start_codon:yes stop_codon:yes gene_type:complete
MNNKIIEIHPQLLKFTTHELIFHVRGNIPQFHDDLTLFICIEATKKSDEIIRQKLNLYDYEELKKLSSLIFRTYDLNESQILKYLSEFILAVEKHRDNYFINNKFAPEHVSKHPSFNNEIRLSANHILTKNKDIINGVYTLIFKNYHYFNTSFFNVLFLSVLGNNLYNNFNLNIEGNLPFLRVADILFQMFDIKESEKLGDKEIVGADYLHNSKLQGGKIDVYFNHFSTLTTKLSFCITGSKKTSREANAWYIENTATSNFYNEKSYHILKSIIRQIQRYDVSHMQFLSKGFPYFGKITPVIVDLLTTYAALHAVLFQFQRSKNRLNQILVENADYIKAVEVISIILPDLLKQINNPVKNKELQGFKDWLKQQHQTQVFSAKEVQTFYCCSKAQAYRILNGYLHDKAVCHHGTVNKVKFYAFNNPYSQKASPIIKSLNKFFK